MLVFAGCAVAHVVLFGRYLLNVMLAEASWSSRGDQPGTQTDFARVVLNWKIKRNSGTFRAAGAAVIEKPVACIPTCLQFP